jgi:hypothetical protein
MKKKKKRIERADSLRIDLNGKLLVLLDTDEWGPLEFRVNDKDAALDIMRVLIEHTDGVSNVDSYTKKEGKKLKKMVDGEE